MHDFNVEAGAESFGERGLRTERSADGKRAAAGDGDGAGSDSAKKNLNVGGESFVAAAKSNSRAEKICEGAAAGVESLATGGSENSEAIVIEAGEVSDDAEETIDVVCDGSAASVKVAHAIGAGSGHGAPERIFGGNFKFRIAAIG